jgi:RNA polymerase II subunit A small phosphatase-like protein
MQANKPTKIPSGRPTTASRPDTVVVNQQNNNLTQPETEKEPIAQQSQPNPELVQERKELVSPETEKAIQPVSAMNGDPNLPNGNTRDHKLADLPKEEANGSHSGPSNPTAAVQIPSKSEPIDADETPSVPPKDPADDLTMDDPEPVPVEAEDAPVARRDQNVNKQLLPPPPPVPQQPPNSNEGSTAPPEAAEQKQQWLLPPITPRFQGKKCLVLDLDETLVHSSFKVSLTLNTCNCRLPLSDPAPS